VWFVQPEAQTISLLYAAEVGALEIAIVIQGALCCDFTFLFTLVKTVARIELCAFAIGSMLFSLVGTGPMLHLFELQHYLPFPVYRAYSYSNNFAFGKYSLGTPAEFYQYRPIREHDGFGVLVPPFRRKG